VLQQRNHIHDLLRVYVNLFRPVMKPAARKQIAAGWEKALGRAKRWEQD